VQGGSGQTWFVHANALDSTTIDTVQNGNVLEDVLFYPWGQFWVDTGLNEFHFAGTMGRDTLLDMDVTPARMYSSGRGRWLSPDPAGRKAVTLTDPQTWNMYAYARNNPTTLTDPSGLSAVDPPTPEGARGCGNSNTSADGCNASGRPETAQSQVTPQSLAAQVPADAKGAIMNALNASNAPTADDKKGGFHEESVKWGTDASGNVVVSPSVSPRCLRPSRHQPKYKLYASQSGDGSEARHR